MNATELESLRAWAQAMLPIQSRQIQQVLAEHDEKKLTAKNVQAHPAFHKDETYCGLEIVWDGPDTFEVWHDGEKLYPQPKTWGDLRALARILGASVDAPTEKQGS
jgi:sarcosine oxidase gamma subunit